MFIGNKYQVDEQNSKKGKGNIYTRKILVAHQNGPKKKTIKREIESWMAIGTSAFVTSKMAILMTWLARSLQKLYFFG